MRRRRWWKRADQQTVRLYDLSGYAASAVHVVHTFEHEAAVLDACWITESLAASVGLDRRVRLYVERL